MNKIVQAVNAMISNPELITNVIPSNRETFFLYKGRYKWSIRRDEDGDYILWYYPVGGRIEDLASIDDGSDWEGVPMVVYKTAELGTREASASFADLYTMVKEKAYGMDDVLKDIISDAETPL